MRFSKICSIAALALIGGCTNFTPQFERPEAPVPSSISGKKTITVGNIELLAWETFFGDGNAKEIIKLALENNRDLQIAAANVAELKGLYQIQQSEEVPGLAVGGGQSATRVSENYAGQTAIDRRYTANIGLVSYELDFWGRIKSLSDAALANYFSSIEAERTTKLNLVSETANAYYNWLMAKENLELAKKTLTSRENSLDLIKARESVGIASALDYAQAEVAKSSVEAQKATAERALSAYYAALALLVGTPVDNVLSDGESINKQHFELTVPENLSAEVLLNRPDIIQAEESLYAANANIGAARAAFFPQITLVGSGGFASADLGNLFKAGSETWSFSPSISLPLFGNSLDANLDVAEARKIKAVAQYEKAVQKAFAEVYTQFMARKVLSDDIDAKKALVKAQRKRLSLSQARYDAGLSSYLEVLDSQQDLFIAEQNLIAAQKSALEATILLYKALGGGDNVDKTAREQYYESLEKSRIDVDNSATQRRETGNR